jgi:aspartate carbamoyltransferase catalytic subunit
VRTARRRVHFLLRTAIARVDKKIKSDFEKVSVILDQVTNGVAVRMAVLYLLGGAHGVSE